ncbi:hypothetical protein JY651_13255 [Pyxidicoccus parkwayensis]|uniref:Uncharacterized protein n=1 Tax=Pyxidicoccus parkwayensis TaxID=2813578 RepID=A0ABX7P5W6_9BACT|nr:hypothetical protein [Pyxidicoccus parkwaysis]QSQ25831.1 hypothetical protein JY651_13255 [Pyxidicoccus parkwaysis]
MQNKHCAVEFHDSWVEAIDRTDEAVVLRLEVYLHVSDGRPGQDPGTGWMQQATLTIGSGSIASAPLAANMRISDGSIQVGEEYFGNLAPVPFKHSGAVTLRFEGAEGLLLVKGQGATLTLHGEPRFVEETHWH